MLKAISELDGVLATPLSFAVKEVEVEVEVAADDLRLRLDSRWVFKIEPFLTLRSGGCTEGSLTTIFAVTTEL